MYDSAGLFALFTLTMAASHGVLVAYNMTTVEHLRTRDQREDEREVLAMKLPCYQFACVFPLP